MTTAPKVSPPTSESTEIAKTKNLALQKEAMSEEHMALAKKTVAADLTDKEFLMFMHVANKAGLDPLTKQIYAMKIKGRVSFMAGVDGLQARANDFPEYKGIRCMAVCEKDTFEFDAMKGIPIKHTFTADRGKATGAWCRVELKDKDAIVVYVSFSEYDTGLNLWSSKPTVMIEKVARSTALRRAFPEPFSGLYGSEEMDQARFGGAKLIQQDQPIDRRKKLPESIIAASKVVESKNDRDVLRKTFMELVKHFGSEFVKATIMDVTDKDVATTEALDDKELKDVVESLEKEKTQQETPEAEVTEPTAEEHPVLDTQMTEIVKEQGRIGLPKFETLMQVMFLHADPNKISEAQANKLLENLRSVPHETQNEKPAIAVEGKTKFDKEGREIKNWSICNGPNCKQRIYWVQTKKGTMQPFNDDGTPHHGTCPDADSFKGKGTTKKAKPTAKEKKAEEGPATKCGYCDEKIARALYALFNNSGNVAACNTCASKLNRGEIQKKELAK